MRDLSSQVADVRRQLEGDEQLRTLMAGLRGANIDDSDYAAEGVTMSLVEVCDMKAEKMRVPMGEMYLHIPGGRVGGSLDAAGAGCHRKVRLLVYYRVCARPALSCSPCK